MFRKKKSVWLFLLPGFAGLMLFYIVPFIGGIWYSLTDGSYQNRFVGLANYISIWQNEMFLLGLKNTLLLSLICAPLVWVLSFVIAALLNRLRPGGVLLPDVAFHHPHGLDVLLDRVVEGVVLAEHPAENGGGLADYQSQTDAQQGNRHQEDHGQAAAHGKAHDEGEDQHQWAADGHADDHHKGHLHVDDIGGHSGHQAGDRELVDVFK